MANKNFKEFVKGHKEEFIIGAIAGVTGIVGGYLLHEALSNRAISKLIGDVKAKPPKVLTPYKSAYGDVTDLWISRTTGNPTATIRDINWQHFGDVGGEFVDYCLDNGFITTMDQPINIFVEIVNE